MDRVLAFLPFLISMACGGGQTPTSPTVELGREFQLQPGQKVPIPGAGFDLTFDKVEDDSRCPVDVTCVWEGDAVVVVKLAPAPEEEAVKRLHSNGGQGRPGEADRGDYVIRLVRLAPQPRSTQPIPPADYRATFVVRRR